MVNDLPNRIIFKKEKKKNPGPKMNNDAGDMSLPPPPRYASDLCIPYLWQYSKEFKDYFQGSM